MSGSEAAERRTVAIHTHGCKLNQADSQTLARQFREAGYVVVGPSSAADVVVLNTCTVTATADSKARQILRSSRRRNPDAVVVATGCYAQRAPAELEKMDAVSLVVGNTAKSDLVAAASLALKVPAAQNVPAAQPGTREVGRTRAMVKIQEGCDQVCAYCIVPKVRGRERSIPSETIVAEINRRAAEGCREVALTGTQLGTYGFDIPGWDLVRLLERVLGETSIERLRVSSLQAHEITEGLLGLWNNPRLMRHFHIPLQSGERFNSPSDASPIQQTGVCGRCVLGAFKVAGRRDYHRHHSGVSW
ncbi:Threonylcarbamoyladenosine tRNA methylthiotransferase MtaB [Geodia barretti]|uniref:Threonylcarbamoyladenosine tRNA methylthiotransferase MtaB n=1 Tax=Geodia barretti TaxID=519541 RepID=A0AA35R951_GEOBA|nr:Threonylcarbamoyladenosine tRNA methylthiotransferase MtaB [Geodia barretti]